jgi:polyphosphate kinase
MYMGSSDMMPRNLLARVAVLFPIKDPALLASIRDNILRIHLSDNLKAMELRPDGTYVPITPSEDEAPLRSQQWFIDHRGDWHGRV